MTLTPHKSVTRFFIPLIDVLILLFCIFLLMPFVSVPLPPEPADETPKEEQPLPSDVQTLQQELAEARRRIARLERERLAKLTDRLAVRVLEIDPTNGVLFYYDPDRIEVRSEADAVRLITKQKLAASQGGVVKDVFFLILYPRRLAPYPTEEQIRQIRQWFRDVPYGFDVPNPSP